MATSIIGCVMAAGAALGVGTGNDLLPDIPAGPSIVTLREVADVSPSRVTDIASPADGSGRTMLVSPQGVIRVLQGGSVLAAPFLDDPASPPDRAMTGLAFHPDFATNGRFYVITGEAVPNTGTPDYVPPQDPELSAFDSVLVEYTAVPAGAASVDALTRRELMRIGQSQRFHNMNDLLFGNDGLLYVAIGDGGDTRTGVPAQYQDNARDLSNPMGGIVRIDVDDLSFNGRYGIPTGNPFAMGGGAPELYAWGLRNPWRLSKDGVTGDIYTGVNGDFTIEWIVRIEQGADYGWPLREGDFLWDPVTGNASVAPMPDPSLTAPLAQYDHNGTTKAWGSIILGPVAGAGLPALEGKVLGLDYVAGEILAMDQQSGALEIVGVDPFGSALTPFREITWGTRADGAALIGRADGKVYEVAPTCEGDADGDGQIGFGDITEVLANWLVVYEVTGPGDADRDGVVGFGDVTRVLGRWLGACP